MRRGIPRVPARVPPPGPADLSSSPSSDTTLSPPPSLSTPPQSCPPPTPLIPLFAALAIITLLTPILYHFFSRSPSLANLSVLLRSPTFSSNGPGGGPEDVHFVLKSLTSYRSAQSSSLKTKRASFKKLGGPQRVLARQLGYPERQERLREAGESNARFLEGMVGLAKREVEGAAGFSASKGGRGDQGRVHEMVKHFVRDWSPEGLRERNALFTPILSLLDDLLPPSLPSVLEGERSEEKRGRVLVPGCGLSRLAWEISDRGFEVDANDYSWYMNLASTLILNHTSQPLEHSLHPYIHSLSHHRSPELLLRSVEFPDVVPRKTNLNLRQGDFLTVFKGDEGQFDAVVTLFFIDTASNILDYLDRIWKSLREGGYWINEGPLLWFGNPTMELTLSEVLQAARLTGFELISQSEVSSDYTGNTEGMFRYIYEAQLFTMRKPVRSA